MEAALPAEGPAQSKGVATPPRGGSSSGSRKPSASTPPAPARSSKAGNPSAAPASPSHPKDDSPAASAAQPSNLTLEGVGNSWADLLRVVRSQNLPLEALLRSGGVVEVEGSTVVIGFAHQFHQSKVEEEANRRMIEDAFEKLLGQAVQVRCTVTAGEAEPDSTAQSAVQPPEEQVEDGLVQAAVERLGARVADLPPERA